MIYVTFIIVFLSCIGSGTYLVATEHYGWAWIPFLIAACSGIKSYVPGKSE